MQALIDRIRLGWRINYAHLQRRQGDGKVSSRLPGCQTRSHSECLEIVAKQSGFADWNTLSAKLDVQFSSMPGPEDLKSVLQTAMLDGACQVPQTAGAEQVSCSFCKKSQHEVRSLIEGRCSRDRIGAHRNCLFICDECVAFCAQVNADLIGGATNTENLSASAPPE